MFQLFFWQQIHLKRTWLHHRQRLAIRGEKIQFSLEITRQGMKSPFSIFRNFFTFNLIIVALNMEEAYCQLSSEVYVRDAHTVIHRFSHHCGAKNLVQLVVA